MTIEYDGLRYYVNGEACRFEQTPGTFGDGVWWTPGDESRALTGEEKRGAEKAFNFLDDLADRCPNCGGTQAEPDARAQNSFGVYEEVCEDEFHEMKGSEAT